MGILGEQHAFCFDVSIDIGAAEPVDRLFRIADEEQAARTQPPFEPRRIGSAVAAQAPQDFGLQRIRVLELVDEDAWITPTEVLSHGFVAREQIAGVVEQVIEIEERRLPLVVGIEFCERVEFGDKSGEGGPAYAACKSLISGVTTSIMGLRRIGQLGSSRLAEPRVFCCILPLALISPSREARLGAMLAARGLV